jgi:protein gp37
MHPDWARSLRDQCGAAGVPFFFKQWGEWLPFGETMTDGRQCLVSKGKKSDFWVDWEDGNHSVRIGKSRAGHLLDGQEWRQMPEGQL